VRGIGTGKLGDVLSIEVNVDTAQGAGHRHPQAVQDQLRAAVTAVAQVVVGHGGAGAPA
jgi:hypothetical protein